MYLSAYNKLRICWKTIACRQSPAPACHRYDVARSTMTISGHGFAVVGCKSCDIHDLLGCKSVYLGHVCGIEHTDWLSVMISLTYDCATYHSRIVRSTVCGGSKTIKAISFLCVTFSTLTRLPRDEQRLVIPPFSHVHYMYFQTQVHVVVLIRLGFGESCF